MHKCFFIQSKTVSLKPVAVNFFSQEVAVNLFWNLIECNFKKRDLIQFLLLSLFRLWYSWNRKCFQASIVSECNNWKQKVCEFFNRLSGIYLDLKWGKLEKEQLKTVEIPWKSLSRLHIHFSLFLMFELFTYESQKTMKK